MTKLSAVLPIKISETHKSNSLELLDILLSSLEKYAEPNTFKHFYIFAPPGEVEAVKSHVERYKFTEFRVWSDFNLIPQLSEIKRNSGWWVQQAIKLAAATVVQTPYYITFDPDVFCTRSINEDTLLPGGKGLLQVVPKATKKNWWSSSANMLGYKRDFSGQGIHVTPAILATDVVMSLLLHLTSDRKHWVKKLLQPHEKNSLHRFHPRFKRKYRWTEYTLYYLHLQHKFNVSDFHVVAGKDVAQTLLSDHSVWKKDSFEDWDAASCFSKEDSAAFCLIQSNKNIAPEVVRKRIEAFIYS